MAFSIWIGLIIGIIGSFIKICLDRHRAFRPLPIIGHLPYFAFIGRQRLLEWIARGFEHRKGRSWRISVPFIGDGWMIEDPSCLKHVLSTRHDAFGKGELATSRLQDLFGDGIILVSGPMWKSQRLAGHHAFTRPTHLERFVQTILPRHLPTLLDPLESACLDPGKIIDVQEVAYAYAMSVFGELAYDTDFRVAKLSGAFVGAFDRAAVVSEGRFTNPAYRLMEWVLPYGRRFRRDVEDVKQFGKSLVRERRMRMEEMEEGDVEDRTKDVVGDKGTLLTELVQQFGRTEDDAFLADACLNFLTAGRDTTAQALSWTIYLLESHPSHIPRLVAELAGSESTLSYTDLTSPTGDLPFTNAIISESLRLHPPVPLEIQENTSAEAISLPDGSIVLPGQKVLWSPWQMGRSIRIWGPDASEFRPERWLPTSSSEKSETKHPLDKTAFEHPVFHAGPRSCLGKNLARAELAYALKEIMGRYEFVPRWDLDKGKVVAAGLTGPIEGGLEVSVRRKRMVE